MTTRVRAPMPGDSTPLPRERGWWIGALGLVVAFAVCGGLTIVDASHPNGYLGHRMTQAGRAAEWVFPANAVAISLTVMAVEAALLILVLQARAKARLGGRAVLLGLLMIVLLIVMSPLAMHAGAPVIEHFMWGFLAGAWLFVFGIGAALHGLHSRRVRPGASNPS